MECAINAAGHDNAHTIKLIFRRANTCRDFVKFAVDFVAQGMQHDPRCVNVSTLNGGARAID
eukprot:22801-Eustigmatos_ZCMA.PRE.1